MLVGSPYDLLSNVSDEIKIKNAAANQQRTVERFHTGDSREGKIAIIGGGPSLADTLDEVKARKHNGVQIWATNNTYKYLVDNGIRPDAHVFLDARPENVEFIWPHPDVTYYLNVACDASLFEKLEGCKVIMYDLSSAATGFTVGIKALYLAAFSGYRDFYLYGFDSSYREIEPTCDAECAAKHIPGHEVVHLGTRQHHAYPQELNDKENIIDVRVEGRTFKAAPWMAIQASEFEEVAKSFIEQGCTITVAGDGLLPFVAHRLLYMPKIVTAVWDLAVCPPTYDIGSFLNEVELHRLSIDAEAIDIIIQPGPLNGFRNDELPPNIGGREGMLFRVAVAMCRLLPSVRNIEILKARRNIDGAHVFPIDYSVNKPIAHYGCHYAQFARPILRATEAAKLHVSKAHPMRYITITTRESSAWPIRNSNMEAWARVRQYLIGLGYAVVCVPDAESPVANLYSFDLDMRVALYEGALVNLGINNGPMMCVPYMCARHIVFKIVTEGVAWTSREFHDHWGTREGDQIGGLGRFVYETDDYEIIVKELELFFHRCKTQLLEA